MSRFTVVGHIVKDDATYGHIEVVEAETGAAAAEEVRNACAEAGLKLHVVGVYRDMPVESAKDVLSVSLTL